MKQNDGFLRGYRKTPRRAFSEKLYKKISGQKSFADWLKRSAAWALMAVMLVYGLSANLLAFNGAGLATTPAADDGRRVTVRSENMALIGERGLKPREFSPPAADDEWLGPFDRPQTVGQVNVVRDSQEMAVVIVPAVSR